MRRRKLCARNYGAKKNFDGILNSPFCTIRCNLDFIDCKTVLDLMRINKRICQREITRLDESMRELAREFNAAYVKKTAEVV